MPYEAGMQIVFDLVDRTIVVAFRGEVKMLGPFLDQKTAVRAGEQFCRDRGWDDAETASATASSGTAAYREQNAEKREYTNFTVSTQ
jgi:hypothetical protein